VWRLCRQKYAKTPFDGFGSAQYGGRWNSTGIYVAYASASPSLSMLELLVHIDRDDVPDDLVFVIANVPNDSIKDVDESTLPANWRAEPPPAELRAVCDTWVQSKSSIGLRVPSVLSPTESNLLINPFHPRIAEVQYAPPEKVVLDPRLFKNPS
jgi:RES domain-containing protein